MKIIALASAASLALSVSLAAQSTPPRPPSTEAKPAPSIAGKWAMTVDIENPDASSTLELKLDGKKVTGSITGVNVYAIEGEHVDGKLTFSMAYNADTTITFTGTLKEDGTLAGTMEYGQGPVTWRAKRKE